MGIVFGKKKAMLEKAIILHSKGELTKAINEYEKCLKATGEAKDIRLFLNLSSLLRQKKEYKRAIDTCKQGIALFPSESGLYLNMGNAYKDEGDLQNAMAILLRAVEIQVDNVEARISLSHVCMQLNMPRLSIAVLVRGHDYIKDNKELNRIKVATMDSVLANGQKIGLKPNIYRQLVDFLEGDISQQYSEIDLSMRKSTAYLMAGDTNSALINHQKLKNKLATVDMRELKNVESLLKEVRVQEWNLSLKLLQSGIFDPGWKMYESGLLVQAKGSQRWQRALTKFYSYSQVSLWRGCTLNNKKLLILSEQALGDTMMFTTLIMKLIDCYNTAELYIYISDRRLVSLYVRSFRLNPKVIIVDKEFIIDNYHSFMNKIDFQIPMGSIPSVLMKVLTPPTNSSIWIQSDTKKTNDLRRKYTLDADSKPVKLIGLSWQGGLIPARIPRKSIDLGMLLGILPSGSNVKYISLQYGKIKEYMLNVSQGRHDIIYDDDIDAMKDVDSWASQVAAMDMVISVANTTIHASGGLGIPTICLLSREFDWRWTEETVYRDSYWYPSVKVVRQSSDGTWEAALKKTKKMVLELIWENQDKTSI